MYLQNLHTHTSFCDGAHFPEEIILTALEKGFSSIGMRCWAIIPKHTKKRC